ncbi:MULTISPECIES: nuclear transport factor 2 family protein [Glutamicibacter]|nr:MULTISPECIES: nuclear transport factor 2 family protein [Glutamicibacter]
MYYFGKAMAMDKLPAPIQQFIDSTNAADSTKFADAFAEDAVLDDWGSKYRGKVAIRSWDSTDNIGVQSKFELVDFFEEQANVFNVTLSVSGNGHNGTGPMRFIVDDGLIRKLEILPD